jgi:hypothetical protein
VSRDLVQLAPENSLEHGHQSRHFGFWAFPVFRRERVERYRTDLESGTGVDDRFDRIGSRLVTEDPRLPELLCPSTVAVHDDGDVTRQTRKIDRCKQLRVDRVGLYDFSEMIAHEL